jgi:hypothetical protein
MPFWPSKSKQAHVENLETSSSNLFIETSYGVNIKARFKAIG